MPLPAMVSHQYVSMYIRIYEHVYTYVCVGVSSQHSMSLHRFPPCVWRQGLSLKLVLTDFARSAGQQVHGIPLFLSPLYLLGLQVHTITPRD